jgi:[acyl-carrier-protein] S-malonyltransferase
MSTFAFIFPGQGSQSIGMGADLAAAFASSRAVFEAVDDALNQPLSTLMWQGDAETLTLTANAQPALMAVSLAAMAALQTEFGVKVTAAHAVAGHSLGEYSALAAAGGLSVPQTSKLLRLRGTAMQQAVPAGQGAMASLIGPKVDIAFAEAAAAEGAKAGRCSVANDNNPGNIVISGDKAGVDAAIAAAKAMGARAIPLNVSAPFHSALMQPAQDAMAAAFADITVSDLPLDLFANVTAAPVRDGKTIVAQLVTQVTGRVRWRESVAAMAAAGVTRFVEVGAGKVLSGMVTRIATGVEAQALNTPADLEAFAKSL